MFCIIFIYSFSSIYLFILYLTAYILTLDLNCSYMNKIYTYIRYKAPWYGIMLLRYPETLISFEIDLSLMDDVEIIEEFNI